MKLKSYLAETYSSRALALTLVSEAVQPAARHFSTPLAPLLVPCAPMAPDVSMENGVSSSPASRAVDKPAATPNVVEVVFGSLLIKPWYPSFYPEELVGRKIERLYVCQWCFKYSKELTGFIKHLVSMHMPCHHTAQS